MDLTLLIAPLAGLGGVLIGLLINGRRENKRFAAQQEFERFKLLAEERRQLFVRTAHALERMNEHLKERAWAFDNDWEDVWIDGVKSRADGLYMLETELRLLAPSLTNNVRAATQTARSLRDSPHDLKESEVNRLLGEYRSYTLAAMSEMRQVLGTEPDDASVLTPVEQAQRKGLLP